MSVIKLKWTYDSPSKSDGYRILVDRFWPGGLIRSEAMIDEWVKDLAPTEALGNWFDFDPFYWEEFKKKYSAELKRNKAMNDFIERHKHRQIITFLYGTKYDKLTHALVLKQFLEGVYYAI
jgi:uncharacterized protein YeaO (DUF488 family)